MSGRVASLFLSLALIGAACSGGGDRPTLTEATLAIDVDVLGSVEERDAAALPTTTDVEVVPTTVAQTSSSTVSTTTTEPDDGPPPAPASVRCGPGAAEGELTLSWDVPDVEDDVLNYRAYVDAGDGRFVQRVNIAAADAGSGDATEW